MALFLVVNMSFLVEFTLVYVQVRSYNSTTYASNTDIQSSVKADGSFANIEKKPGVTSSKDFHMSNAVFLPLPANEETTSQPVNAWSIGRARAFSLPSPLAMLCAGMYLSYLPVPNAIQISVSLRQTAVDTARTRTSVSTVRNMILRYPWLTESIA